MSRRVLSRAGCLEFRLTLPSAASSNPNGYAVKISFSGNVPAAN